MLQIKPTDFVQQAIDESRHFRVLADDLLTKNKDKEAALMFRRSIELCIEASSLSMDQAGSCTEQIKRCLEKIPSQDK